MKLILPVFSYFDLNVRKKFLFFTALVLTLFLESFHLYSAVPASMIDGRRVFTREAYAGSGWQDIVVNQGEEFTIATGIHDSATPTRIPDIVDYQGNKKNIAFGDERVFFYFKAKKVGSGVIEIKKTPYSIRVTDLNLTSIYVDDDKIDGKRVFTKEYYGSRSYQPIVVWVNQAFCISVGIHDSATPTGMTDIISYQGNKTMTFNNRTVAGEIIRGPNNNLITLPVDGYSHIDGDQRVIYFFQAKKTGSCSIEIRKIHYPIEVVELDETNE
ncbi:MAG: hypothetical protein ACH346_01830 [Chthoniobacterales bacterium]